MGVTVAHRRTIGSSYVFGRQPGNGWWWCWPCQNDTQRTWRGAGGGGAEPHHLPPHLPFYFLSFAFISLYILLYLCLPSTLALFLNSGFELAVIFLNPTIFYAHHPKTYMVVNRVLLLWINSALVSKCGRSWPINPPLLLPLWSSAPWRADNFVMKKAA